MQCLILAAGRGSRLRSKADSKPLLPLLGLPLIERSIRAAHAAGADAFIVVTGYAAERVEAFLERLARRMGVPIRCVRNPDWAHGENGASVLAARGLLEEDFLLLMADHLVDEALLRRLLACPPPAQGVTLAVDGARDNPLVDLDDVTRVRLEGERIRDIGKGLPSYDGYDTGAFFCTPALFDALERAGAAGDSSLSGAIRLLAETGHARACRVDGCFWIDVDDPAAVSRAERALLARLRAGKPTDGPVARWLNRPLSVWFTRHLARHAWATPNRITLFSFGLSALAAALLALPGHAALAAGGLLAQLASVLDGCDGEIARLRHQASDYGGWLDAVLDRYADALLVLGCTWHAAQAGWGTTAWLWGYAAATGSFLLSYTADKYDARMRARIEAGARPGLRLGRDVRILLLMLAALANLPLAWLVLMALWMNLETLRRIVSLRPAQA